MPLTLKILAVYFTEKCPGDFNKYLGNTFAITSPDPILYASHDFVYIIMLNFLKSFILRSFAKSATSHICVHVQSLIFKTVWLIQKKIFTQTAQGVKHNKSKIKS